MNNENMTLAQVRDHIEKEGFCLGCNRSCRATWRNLPKTGVHTLQKMYQSVLANNTNQVDVGDIGLTYAERSCLTILRFHALIAKVKDENGRHKHRQWLITRRGAQFLRNQIAIPAKVKTYENRVVDHSTKTVTIIDVLSYDPKLPPAAPFEMAPATQANVQQVAML